MADYTARTLTYEIVGPDAAPATGATITAHLLAGGADAVFGEDLPLLAQPLAVPFTETPGEPGTYSASLIPNTGALDGTRYRIEQVIDGHQIDFYILMPDEDVGPGLTAEIEDIHEVEALATAPETSVLNRIFAVLRTTFIGGSGITVTPDVPNRTITLTFDGSSVSFTVPDGSVGVDQLTQGVRDSINASIADVVFSDDDRLFTFAKQGGGDPIDIDLPGETFTGAEQTKLAGINPSTAAPLAPGTASAGSGTDYARGDHVHPAQDVPQPSDDTPLQSAGSGSAGTEDEYSRKDHVHPAPAAGLSAVMSDGFSVKGDGTSTNRLRATGLKSQSALPAVAAAADGDRVIANGIEYERVESTGARNVITGTLGALPNNRLGFDGLILGSRTAGTPPSYLPTLLILKSVVDAASRPASIWIIATNHTTRAVAQDALTYTSGSDTGARWAFAGGDIRLEAESGDVISIQVFQEDSGGKGAPLNVEAALAKWVPTGGSSQEQPTTGGGSATVDQTSVYTPAKDIIQGGHGVDVVPDDTAETLTLNASVPSGDELPDRSLWTVGYDFDLLQEDTITHDFCGPGVKHSPDTITYQFTGGPNNAPAFIISYSPEYSGSGSAVVAGKTFVAIGGTYTMPSDAMLTAYFEGDARTQYAVTQQRADAALPSWHEVPTLSYATLNRPGFRLCRNFSSASTNFEIYPSVTVPPGAKVYAGAGHGDAGWVNRPGVAAPWATQGQPEPRTLLALTTFIDGPGIGLAITNSSSDVTPAPVFFNYPTDPNDPSTIGAGGKFILGSGDGRLGTVNVEAGLTIPPNIRSDQQIGFGVGGNDLTWRLAGWVTAQTGLTATAGLAIGDGNILNRVSVYRGSTRIGEVQLLQVKAADDQGGYRLVYDGLSGAYNFSITSQVEAFFVHNDGPAASAAPPPAGAAPAPFDTVSESPSADVVIAVPSGDTWYPLDDAQGNEVWQTIETISPTAAQAGRVLFLGQIHAESSHSNGGGDRIYYQTRLMMRSASGADSLHVKYIRNSGQQDADFQAITRIGTDEIVAEATVAAGQHYDLQARVLAQVAQAGGQARTVTFDRTKNYLKMIPIGRSGGDAFVRTLVATSGNLNSTGLSDGGTFVSGVNNPAFTAPTGGAPTGFVVHGNFLNLPLAAASNMHAIEVETQVGGVVTGRGQFNPTVNPGLSNQRVNLYCGRSTGGSPVNRYIYAQVSFNFTGNPSTVDMWLHSKGQALAPNTTVRVYALSIGPLA